MDQHNLRLSSTIHPTFNAQSMTFPLSGLLHAVEGHLGEQCPAKRQYRDDFRRAGVVWDPSNPSAFAEALRCLVVSAMERGCLFFYDEYDASGKFLHTTCEVITWPGIVVVFQCRDGSWQFVTAFFTHCNDYERPTYRTTLAARGRWYGMPQQQQGRVKWCCPTPEHQVVVVNKQGEKRCRTNFLLPEPEMLGYYRGVLHLDRLPLWPKPVM